MIKSVECDTFSTTVGWATGGGPVKTGCWFVDGDDWTAALRVLLLQFSSTLPSTLAPIKSRTVALPGLCWKMAVVVIVGIVDVVVVYETNRFRPQI